MYTTTSTHWINAQSSIRITRITPTQINVEHQNKRNGSHFVQIGLFECDDVANESQQFEDTLRQVLIYLFGGIGTKTGGSRPNITNSEINEFRTLIQSFTY